MELLNENVGTLLEKLYSSDDLDFEKISQLLGTLRVLTREKSIKPELLDQRCLCVLVDFSVGYHTEAQKCISNLILNYPSVRDRLIEPYIECVESRWQTILTDQHLSIEQLSSKIKRCELLYYDLRIIFLLSALCSSSRNKIRERLLDHILKITEKEAEQVSPTNYLLLVESLKTIFNLTLDKCSNKTLVGNVIKKLFVVVGTEEDLTNDHKTKEKLELTDKLLVNLIHLLTNMPAEVYTMLSFEDTSKILEHLDHQLKTYSKQNFRETVLPVLNVCANICKFNEDVRKRWFDNIIGSTKEFEKRPEEYDDLRGRLVKLMTSIDVYIKDVAAEFIHALCGGDTEKFITYTGFGNSAAFLSSRGLLKGDRKTSLVSEDIDYQHLRNKIDPITGKLETQRKDPMEGMTDEEKEFHASELADAITKLSNLGVLRPMGIDHDRKISEIHPDSKDNIG